MKALILAAGKGTRLGALTAAMPKPMLPVGNQPLLARTLAWLRQHGVTQVAINLHHAADVIVAGIEDGGRWGVQVTWSHEERLLGTAGAARKLQPFLDERFWVVYGDVFLNIDLGRLAVFHDAQLQATGRSAGLTMALYRVPNPTECGLVELAPAQDGCDVGGRVLRFVEKPPAHAVFTDLANAGLYICDPPLLELVPPETEYDFGRDLLPRLLATGVPVFGAPLAPGEFVIDIGTPAGLERAQQQAHLLDGVAHHLVAGVHSAGA
jgi:NDP-sugar pyrophosphorylase family protein